MSWWYCGCWRQHTQQQQRFGGKLLVEWAHVVWCGGSAEAFQCLARLSVTTCHSFAGVADAWAQHTPISPAAAEGAHSQVFPLRLVFAFTAACGLFVCLLCPQQLMLKPAVSTCCCCCAVLRQQLVCSFTSLPGCCCCLPAVDAVRHVFFILPWPPCCGCCRRT